MIRRGQLVFWVAAGIAAGVWDDATLGVFVAVFGAISAVVENAVEAWAGEPLDERRKTSWVYNEFIRGRFAIAILIAGILVFFGIRDGEYELSAIGIGVLALCAGVLFWTGRTLRAARR